ncbi:glycosyltransferase family 1 protein [Ramaria rubella]|nr:glycosyltransferase family 1 protein [Ramaria rubella]
MYTGGASQASFSNIMEDQTKFSGHVVLFSLPAWGHLRPLCSLACKIVEERSDIAVTFFIAGALGPQVEAEISRYFPESGSKSQAHIRIVNIGGNGFEPFTLMPLIMQNLPVFHEKMINNEPLQCSATGKTFGAIRKPNVAVIDFILLPILQAFRRKTGKHIPIFAWQWAYCSSVLRISGPEELGGVGDVASVARKQAEATGGQYEAILDELYRPATGNLITVPELPPMRCDTTPSPENLLIGAARRQFRKKLSKGLIFYSSYIFSRECDGFLAVSSPVFEAESLNAMRAWLAETNRPIYAIGPLMPPGVGGVGLSETSKKAEVSFGTLFWPPKDEYVLIFVDAFMELDVPFVLSWHPTKEVQVPESFMEKVKQSGLGLVSKWCPQQTILNHKATGWMLTHCGQNGVTEALTQGIPIMAWPLEADQPSNAAHLTLNLDVGFELIEVRTGYGLRPLHRGVTPKGTIEAVAAEARDVLRRAQGPEGARKRRNAKKLRDDLRKEWDEGGNALTNLRQFLDNLCPSKSRGVESETNAVRVSAPTALSSKSSLSKTWMVQFEVSSHTSLTHPDLHRIENEHTSSYTTSVSVTFQLITLFMPYRAVVKASGLSKCPIRTRKYYALVHIDSGETYRTKTVRSRNPKWKEPFDLVARDPSMIVIVDIFQVINEAEKIIGRASVSVSECFQPEFQNIERSYDLSDASNQKAGKLKVSLSTHIRGSTEAVALDAHLPITGLQAIVLPVVTIASLGLNILVLESLMQGIAASHVSTPFGVGIAGIVIDVGSNVIASDSFSTVMGFLTRFVEIGNMVAEVHPYAKFVWDVLTSMRRVLKAQQDQDDKVKQLWATILDTLDFMKQAEDAEIPERIKGVEKTVQAIMKQIYDCALFLRRYGEEGFKGRTLNNASTAKTDDSIQQFTDAFADLRIRFRERIDLDKWRVARTMKDGVLQLVTKTDQLIDIAERNDLKDLPGAKLPDVQWDPSRACMLGTRTQIIGDIISWVHNPDSERILWLSGAAGTGKSSIANSIAEPLDSVGRLGASFRFDRQTATIETRGQLFGNLCHQLALYDGQLRTAILTAINKTNIYGMSLRDQARKIIVETTRSSEIVGPVVIIIDALDECGDDHSTIEPTRGTLVQAIVEELPKLSSSIKVLITSRDEGIISNLFTQCRQCFSWTMHDVQSTEEVILKYVQHQMSLICQSHGTCLDNWPGAAKETEIAHYADGLFIWADIACTHIGQGDPAIQLSRLLKSAGKIKTVGSRLEKLINHVFHHSLQEAIGANEWHYVVDSIVTLKTPLTLEEMDTLLGLSEELSD